ncbi:hypothetical protein KIN20_037270 [Parelaphostrongylus tenuis]|uniref:Uncharacterized protein n=1 Tax=Parelaphostrongylus tenuis TaxID=148309 RepID=A0AAD5RE52_PARTN|nr:hypothetical protein KIN20_037270 [Parelaphostrongylus tenuis]
MDTEPRQVNDPVRRTELLSPPKSYLHGDLRRKMCPLAQSRLHESRKALLATPESNQMSPGVKGALLHLACNT